MKKKQGHIVRFEARELSGEEREALQALALQPDDTIDTSDIAETDADDWRGAEVGRFYRPLKQQLTLRVDADILAWFKRGEAEGRGYQTRINHALREYVAAHSKKAG